MILPHLIFGPEELDRRYPPLVAPEAVDTEDLTKDEEDGIIVEGNKVVKDFIQQCAVQGRRRHLSERPLKDVRPPGT